MKCKVCKNEAVVALKSHNAAFCRDCYLAFFRRQLCRGIENQKLLRLDDNILVAISGGKDSLTLMLELHELGYKTTGLFIDLGIPGSSDVAKAKISSFCQTHNLPLETLELAGEGLEIPRVKERIHRPVCSVCGKIKRYYFNKAAVEGGYSVLATGHNLDDEVARLMSNTLRWDADYLSSQGPCLPAAPGFAAKIKPLWRLGEFEIANYAFLRGIDYHCAVCPYSPGATFSTLKGWMHELELKMPGRKLDFYQGFLARGKKGFEAANGNSRQDLAPCESCGSPTSGGGLCGVCRLKEAMRRGKESAEI